MESIEYIDDYFEKKLSIEESSRFEKRLKEDDAFASEVAFYVSVKQAAKEEMNDEKKKRFREIYKNNNVVKRDQAPVISLLRYAAAAAIIAGIVWGVFTWTKPVSTEQLANNYIQDNLKSLGVTMSSSEDSLQSGLRSYNELKYSEALSQFESIIQSDSSNFTAIEYAGISALQLKQFDKALHWFTQLENQSGLFSNPGKFYHALTLMKRNLPGDRDKSYQLLNEVVAKDLAGKHEAEKWLKNW